MTQHQDTIRTLCQIYGPSGHEARVIDKLEEMVAPHADEVRRDVMGNLMARVGSGGRKLMFAAHADEIGLVVHFVDKQGFARITPIGGVNPIWLSGRRVEFEDGTLGVISHETRGVKPSEIGFQHLFIDTGVVADGPGDAKVNVGDFAVFQRPTEVQNGMIISKALDDRIGCATLVEAMRKLAKQSSNECWFVFTVQEEVGIRGARTSAFGIEPDVGYAVDVTGWGDTPMCEPMSCSLGKGVAIKAMDMGLVVSPKVRALMERVAEENGVPYQIEVLRGGATDAAAIQYTKMGVPCGVVSIPTRYVHSPSEIAHLGDFGAAVDLVAALANADHESVAPARPE